MISPPAAERHPHLGAARRPGHVRVDFHMHTMWSGDATTTPDELRDAVVATNLDVLCITDHGTVNGALALAEELPCRVVVGQEVRTWAGELIGLFLQERLPYGLPAHEAVVWITLAPVLAAEARFSPRSADQRNVGSSKNPIGMRVAAPAPAAGKSSSAVSATNTRRLGICTGLLLLLETKPRDGSEGL